MEANHLMTLDVTCIDEDTPISMAWDVMQQLHVRHLPVLEAGKLVGIVSDRDLLLQAKRRVDGGIDFPELCAAEVMSFDPIACAPDADVSELATVMLEHKIDSVPITTLEGQLLGIVTTGDLLSLIATHTEIEPRKYVNGLTASRKTEPSPPPTSHT